MSRLVRTVRPERLGFRSPQIAKALGTLLALVLLSSCGHLRDQLIKANEGIVAAAPIDESLYSDMGTAVDQPARNLMVGRMAIDSARKCAIFENGLGTSSRVTNGFLDVVTTTLAALGATFTPVNTVRALAASAAISSGTKTALEADVFAQKTTPAIVGWINANYFAHLTGVVGKSTLSTVEWPTTVAVFEVLALHNQCSLDAALSGLNATVAQTATLQQQVDTLKTLLDKFTPPRK